MKRRMFEAIVVVGTTLFIYAYALPVLAIAALADVVWGLFHSKETAETEGENVGLAQTHFAPQET